MAIASYAASSADYAKRTSFWRPDKKSISVNDFRTSAALDIPICPRRENAVFAAHSLRFCHKEEAG